MAYEPPEDFKKECARLVEQIGREQTRILVRQIEEFLGMPVR